MQSSYDIHQTVICWCSGIAIRIRIQETCRKKRESEKNQNECQILIKNLQAYRIMKTFTIAARRVSPSHTLYASACFVDHIFFRFLIWH